MARQPIFLQKVTKLDGGVVLDIEILIVFFLADYCILDSLEFAHTHGAAAYSYTVVRRRPIVSRIYC